MNFSELKNKLDAIAEEMETIQQEANMELSPGVSIKTDKPGAYKGTKKADGSFVGGKGGEAMFMAKRIIDKIEMEDPASDAEARQLFTKYAGSADKEVKSLVMKELRRMDFFKEDEDVQEGKMKDQLIKDSETMSKEEFAKKYGNEMAEEYFEAVEVAEEEIEVAEEEVEEATITVPVQELIDIMQLAGYNNYADKIEEYANEPDEQYQDVEDQLIGLSGGLNGPKSMHPAAAGGDNPMDQEPRKVEEGIDEVSESLYKSYKNFLEEVNKED